MLMSCNSQIPYRHLKSKRSKHQNPNSGRGSPLPSTNAYASSEMSAIIHIYMGFLYIMYHTHACISPIFSLYRDCWLRDAWKLRVGALTSWTAALSNTTTLNPPKSSLIQLKQQQWWVHYKGDLKHVSLAPTVLLVHPVRISRNQESYNNM